MKKLYINKIDKVKLEEKELLNNFDIFEIRINYVKDETYSILNALKELTNDIYALKYENSTNAFALIKKDSVTKKQIIDKIKPDREVEVEQIKVIKNDFHDTVLNLLLFSTMYNNGNADFPIVNDAYCKILNTKAKSKNQIMTLEFKFKDNALIYKINTFTKYKAAKKNKKKQKFIINGKCMSKVSGKELSNKTLCDEENLYVYQGNNKKKNTLNTFNTEASSIKDSKFYELNDLVSKLKENKYIKKLTFKEMEVEDLFDNKFNSSKEAKEFIDYTSKYCVDLINKIGLNIFYQDGIKNEKIDETLIDLGITNFKTSNTPDKDFLNLFVIDNGEKGKDKESDEKYLLYKDYICQHIGKNNLTGSIEAKIKTCIYNLVIKYECKQKEIKSFDWNEFSKYAKSSFYEFYTFIEKNEKWLYCMMRIDITGKILEFKYSENSFNNIFDDYCEQYKNNCIIKDEKGNITRILDTELFMIPNLEKFDEYIKAIELGMKQEISYGDYNECFSMLEMETKNKDLSKLIEAIYKEIPELGKEKYKERTIKLSDLKSKMMEVYSKSSKGWKEIKLSLEQYFFIKYLITPKWYYDLKGFKDGKAGNELYPGFKNIHYNKDYYLVSGYKAFQTSKNFINNVLLRQIEIIDGDNFFEELLLMLMNPIVKTDMLTVYPFIYKYIREMI